MAGVSPAEGDPVIVEADGIQVRRIREPEQLVPLRDRWNELLAKSDTPTAELSSEWQMTFWKHFHEDDELYVLVAEAFGHLVGIAPLKLRKIRVNGAALHRLGFIAASESNYQDFITDDRSGKVHAAMWRYLQAHRQEWDRLDLENVPAVSQTIGCFARPKVAPALHFTRKRTRCLHLAIDRPWDAYLASRPRKTREHFRYRVKKLDSVGTLKLSRITEGPEVSRILDGMFEFHQARWNRTSTPSKFADGRMRSFYRECMDSLGKPGLMVLYALTAADVLVATDLVFHMNGIYLDQITSHTADLEKLSPSVVLKRLLLEEVFGQGDGAKLFDFGTWYEYKRVWTEEEHEKVTFEVYAGRSLRHFYCYATTALLMGARELLKRVTWLRVAIQRLRQVASRQPKRTDPDAGSGSV